MNFELVPIISVIIPSYNKARYLQYTIRSVLNQTFRDWELIIIDDNSTDGSGDLIKKLAATDSRIKFRLNEENKGGNYCRNIGISLAKAEYLIFLDADDLLTDFCLAQRVSEMQKDNRYDFLIFPTGTFYKEIGDSDRYWKAPKGGDHLRDFLQHQLPWNITSPIWRTEFVRKSGGFDEHMVWLQDVEFHTRMLLADGVRYKIIDNIVPDFYYRIDQERLVAGNFNYVKNYVQGQLMYIRKMLEVISTSDFQFELNTRYLKGSLASALRMVLYNAYLKKISPVQQTSLLALIMGDQFVVALLSKKDRLLIRIYKIVYAIGLNKLKGVDTIFKHLFTK